MAFAKIKASPDMPTEHLGYDPNGIVRNASQGFGGAARQAIVNAREKRAGLKGRGLLDLIRRRLQSPKRARHAVSEVRAVPANPFENTENYEPRMEVAVVSNMNWRREWAWHPTLLAGA